MVLLIEITVAYRYLTIEKRKMRQFSDYLKLRTGRQEAQINKYRYHDCRNKKGRCILSRRNVGNLYCGRVVGSHVANNMCFLFSSLTFHEMPSSKVGARINHLEYFIFIDDLRQMTSNGRKQYFYST